MPAWSTNDLRRQLLALQETSHFGLFRASARAYGVPLPLWLAIGSRETSLTNTLGDDCHGVGYVQVDVRYHRLARQMRDAGTWRSQPGRLLDLGAQILANYRTEVRDELPHLDERGGWKVAASAYNAGPAHAIEDSDAGDSDLRTAGHDYGADCLARARVFARLLGVPPM